MRLIEGFPLVATAPDGIARLRELILSLAVQGKLVPQDPNDEPVSELLKRIKAEKDRLMADAGMRTSAQLEVPGEEKYVGEVPGWEYCRLGNLARFIDYRGRTPQKVEAGIPLITAKNVRFGFVSREPREYIAEKDYPAWMTRGFPRVGDLLFTTEAPLGNIALIDITDRFALAQRVICFQLHDLSVGPYLRLAIMSAQVQEQLSTAASGMTATGIKASRLKEIPIAIPPLAEQRRIVKAVDDLLGLCDELEMRGRLEAEQHAWLTTTLFDALAASESSHALAENWSRVAAHFDLLLDRPEAVDAFEQTILQLAVRGVLVRQDSNDEPADELLKRIRTEKDDLIAKGKIKRDRPVVPVADGEKLFELPAGWAWARMPQIAESRLGKMLDKAKNTGASYPYLRNTNVQWNRFELADIKVIQLEDHERDEYRLRDGDLLICEGGEPGRCAIWREEASEMYFQKALHRVRALGGVLPEYLALCLESDANSSRLEQYFTGATIKHFAGQELSRYCVPLPPVTEQVRIIDRVGELRLICDDLRNRIVARQTCQFRLAEALVEQTASTDLLTTHSDDLAAAA